MTDLLERLHTETGTVRLQTLLKVCTAHKMLGGEAEHYFIETIALANQLRQVAQQAKALIHFAQFKDLHGEQGKANELLNEAMKLLVVEPLNDETNALLGEAHFTLGVVKKKLHANHHALNAFEQAVRLFEKTTDRDGLAKSLIRLGGTKNEMGDIEGALNDISKALRIAEAQNNEFRTSHAHNSLGNIFFNQGNFTLALKHFFNALPFTEKTENHLAAGTLLRNIGNVYAFQSDLERAESYHQKSLNNYRTVGNEIETIHQLANLGSVLLQKKKYREAKKHLYEAVEIADKIGAPNTLAYTYFSLGQVYFEEHNTASALEHFEKARTINTETDDKRNLALTLNGIAATFIFSGEIETAEPYLLDAIETTREAQLLNEEKETLKLLSEVRKQQRRYPEALMLYEKYAMLKEQLLNADKIREAEALQTQMAIENKEKEIEIERLRNIELKTAYEQLKAAQHRLIQQEKLASLGQLTAGVAHEIQNPLNFVNNYSDLSVELLEELAAANDDAERSEIIEMLRANLTSIHKNGNRAGSIVKSMLEHSNAGKSERVASDINHILREHLQFAYSGFKAGNSTFECAIETATDNSIPDVVIAPSEIGKALLNILNNAFYAMKQRALSTESVQPKLRIETYNSGDVLRIKISDNGGGIAAGHEQQIFEPFFTTKPTGEGVGLGLSIANDIVQSHGGNIELENMEGEGAAFTIIIPHG